MSNTKIASVTDKKSFGSLFVKEHVETTLSLYCMDGDKLGIGYESKFDGLKDGHVHGDPIEITGNMHKTIHQSPTISINISKFEKSATDITMEVKISVDAPVLGECVIFNKVLSGKLVANPGWHNVLKLSA